MHNLSMWIGSYLPPKNIDRKPWPYCDVTYCLSSLFITLAQSETFHFSWNDLIISSINLLWEIEKSNWLKYLTFKFFENLISDRGVQVGSLIHITTGMFSYYLQCPFTSILWDIKLVMKVHENRALELMALASWRAMK